MAFTNEEKSKVQFYLGYSFFEDDGPAIRAINGMDQHEARIGFIVRDLLHKLDDVRDQMHKTIPLGKAIEDGSIKLRAHYTLDHLMKLGKIYCNDLARFTKIKIDGDVFSTSSNARDGDGFYAGDPSEKRFT